MERDLQQERLVREAGDQQMEMLKSELRKAEDSLATITKDTVDTGTVDKIRKMKNQNESLGAENFEYAVENVGFDLYVVLVLNRFRSVILNWTYSSESPHYPLLTRNDSTRPSNQSIVCNA